MAGFNVNLDRRGVSGNAPGSILRGGAQAVNQARNQRNQAFQQLGNSISNVIDKRRRQNDALTNIETIGGWDLELRRREQDLDPSSATYEKDYDEMVGEIVDLDPDKFQTSDGLAAAQRAAESFRNSARVQAFENAQEAMIARRDATVKQAINTAANRTLEQPDNADAHLTEMSMILKSLDMTDQERDAVSMAAASGILEAKHRGLIQQNRFKEAEEVEQEAIELWSHDTFVRRGASKDAAVNAAKAKAKKMREDAISHHINQVDVALKQSESIQNPLEREEVQSQIVNNLSGLLESEGKGPLSNKITAVLKRAIDTQNGNLEAKRALQRIQSAANYGLGSSQADVDLAAEYVGSADPENSFANMVSLSKKARTMPSKLRVMYRTAGDNAQSLGMMAEVGRELEEELVPLPDNPRVTMTQAYSETQGIPYEEAAQMVTQNAPTEQEMQSRKEYWRQGRAIGIDFRDMETVRELGEDMFDQSWFWDPQVAHDFLADAQRAHETAWTMTGDAEMAKNVAEHMLRKQWGYSETTGRVQKMPPDRFIAAKLTLPELHENIGEAAMVQIIEDLQEAGVVIPASADRRRGSAARHGDVKRWEENSYDGMAFKLVWDGQSEQHYRNTGEATWAIQTLNANGTWYAETTTEGEKLRWSVAGIDLENFPKAEGEEYRERLRKAQDWNNARAYR